MTNKQDALEVLLKKLNNDIGYLEDTLEENRIQFDKRSIDYEIQADERSIDYEFGNLYLTLGDLKTIRATLTETPKDVTIGMISDWAMKVNSDLDEGYTAEERNLASDIMFSLCREAPKVDVEILRKKVFDAVDANPYIKGVDPLACAGFVVDYLNVRYNLVNKEG